MNRTQAEALVRQLYASIGRSGMGSSPSQIDQGGFDFWVGQLTSGAIAPTSVNSEFKWAIDNFVAQNPTNEYSKYIKSYQSSADNVAQLYRDVLGREPDPEGLMNWVKQFGSDVSQQERDLFVQFAQPEIAAKAAQTAAQATPVAAKAPAASTATKAPTVSGLAAAAAQKTPTPAPATTKSKSKKSTAQPTAAPSTQPITATNPQQ